MGGVSAEQVAKAREIDLLSYLQTYEPGELKPDGPGRYTTVSHETLVISRGKWIWNGGGGIGGVSALDYLVKVRGLGFVEAVERLTDSFAFTITPRAQAPPVPEKRPFYPPKPLRYSNGAVSYLQRRGISLEVIARCMDVGILFESRYYNLLTMLPRFGEQPSHEQISSVMPWSVDLPDFCRKDCLIETKNVIPV